MPEGQGRGRGKRWMHRRRRRGKDECMGEGEGEKDECMAEGEGEKKEKCMAKGEGEKKDECMAKGEGEKGWMGGRRRRGKGWMLPEDEQTNNWLIKESNHWKRHQKDQKTKKKTCSRQTRGDVLSDWLLFIFFLVTPSLIHSKTFWICAEFGFCKVHEIWWRPPCSHILDFMKLEVKKNVCWLSKCDVLNHVLEKTERDWRKHNLRWWYLLWKANQKNYKPQRSINFTLWWRSVKIAWGSHLKKKERG